VIFVDCGDARGGDLRRWVESPMTAANLRPDGAIRILRNPRILGYVFNPLTVYYYYRRSGAQSAILYELSNRHAERHTYVIPITGPASGGVRQSCRKEFYVSPFARRRVRERLAPGGAAALQIITMADAAFQSYRRRIDFIQRYVFLGGMLPSLNTSAATSAGIMSSRTSGLGLVALV
jgi:uncharacterized protein